MYSESQVRTLLSDLRTALFFYKHKDYTQEIELKSKIEVLEWILEKD